MELHRLNLYRCLDICKKAVNSFSKFDRSQKCKEELIELLFEFTRFEKGTGDYDVNDMIDELADVFIMIFQMALIMGPNETLLKINEKISRLEVIILEYNKKGVMK